MNTYTFLALLAICAVCIFQLYILTKINKEIRQEHSVFVDGLLFQHNLERKDLVDRLMSRDLKEVKQAQAITTTEPRVVSKRANDEKLAEEARKVAERG